MVANKLELRADGELLVERARALLAQASTVDEAKGIRDQLAALGVYARARGAAEESVRHATIARLWAERRIGELTRAMPKASKAEAQSIRERKRNGAADTLSAAPPTKREALDRAKLDERQARRWEKLAEIPETKFGAWALERVDGSLKAARKAEEKGPAHVARGDSSQEWGTPVPILNLVRKVLGAIDLDPCSTEAANARVKARRFHGREADGLKQGPWRGRIYMNPPYAECIVDAFVAKLCHDVQPSDEAIVLTNNATETVWAEKLQAKASAMCFPRGRISFLDQDGSPQGKPLQGQMIAYLGRAPRKFVEVFSAIGQCWVRPDGIPF